MAFYLIHLIMQAKANPYLLFWKPILNDKKGEQFSRFGPILIYDNCKLDDASITQTDAGTINGCGEGWISRTWTIKDKCGNGSKLV